MADLIERKTTIDLAEAKPTGLGDLGVPVHDGMIVKKGKLHEFTQLLADGGVGRMFQNLRVIAVKTAVGGAPSAKLFILLEAFGDNNVPVVANSSFDLKLYAGTECLLELSPGSLFLPYANFWYDNRFVFDLSTDAFDRLNRLEFIAKADQVVAL
ncbi:MAG TPA: hypothetical protein VMV35_07840 [Halothiobacillus sp.]|nr:hypothetical protein [Halothiobacillus sp.]